MIYKIKSIHFTDDDSVYVSSDYCQMVAEYLIAYIQFSFNDFVGDYGLSPQQVGNILNVVYGFESKDETDNYIELDLFDIWETYCMAAGIILNITMFHNDKLHTEFVKHFHEILYD